MRTRDFALAVLPLVVTHPVLAQEGPSYGLGAGVGLGVIHQPARGFPGVTSGLPSLEVEKDAHAGGPIAAAVGAIELGRAGDIPIYFELSGYVQAVSSGSVVVHGLAGVDSMMVSIGSLQGVIDLGAAASSGSSMVSSPTAGNANVSGSTLPGGGEQALLALNRSASSGIYAAVATGGTPERAAAYGAMLSSEGFVFAGVGDMDGTLVRSDVRRSTFRAGLDGMLVAPVPLGDGWSVTPGLGGAYRYQGEEIGHELLIDPYEGAALPDRFPTVGVRTLEHVHGHMIGPVASVSVSKQIDDRWGASLGFDAGWLLSSTRWSMEAVGIMEGLPETALPGASAQAFGGSGLFRLKGGVSYVGDNGTVLSLNAQMEHLTAAPTTVATGGGSGGNPLVLSNPASGTTSLTTTPTFDYAVSLSLSKSF